MICVLGLAGCGKDQTWPGRVPATDSAMFTQQVYPLLMRDCAFNSTCHGDPQRFFQVYGPGRRRENDMLDSEMPATPMEIQLSYEHATSMLVTQGAITNSLLLTKPLAAKAGGSGHKGSDHFGRNVYQSTLDPSYMVLLAWAATAKNAVPSGTAGAGTGTAGTGTAGRGMTGIGNAGTGIAGRGTAGTGVAGTRGAAGTGLAGAAGAKR